MTDKPTTTEAYLAALGAERRSTVERLQATVRAAAPGAEESFSYGMPGFTLAAGAEMRAHFAMFLDFDGGLIRRQRNYDCFEPF